MGFARTKKTDEELREHLRPLLVKESEGDEKSVDKFLEMCFYNYGTAYGDWEAVLKILQNSQTSLHNLLVYLAIPPYVFEESALALKTALEKLERKVPGFIRIVLEKPFGHDTDSCNELLQHLRDQKWEEKSLYRIDHYLGKEMVQNILTLRENNPFLKALWNKDTVEAVHLVFKESIGTQGRGG